MRGKSHFVQYSSFCKQEGKEDFHRLPATVTDVQYRLLAVVHHKYSTNVRMSKKPQMYGWLPAKLAVNVGKNTPSVCKINDHLAVRKRERDRLDLNQNKEGEGATWWLSSFYRCTMIMI